MTTEYTYNSIDYNYDIMFNDIKCSDLYKKLTEMYRNGDDIHITFLTLDAGEITLLNSITTNHNATTGAYTTFSYCIEKEPKDNTIKSETYTKVVSFPYAGSLHGGDIVKIHCISYMDSGIDSYSLKLYDKTNFNVIAENTFTNNEEGIVELVVNQDNVPNLETLLELQTKLTITGQVKKKRIYIKSICVYCNSYRY